ncbi:TELO2-interacting protein 1, partial [Phenoliferia sp. Uapishka_3]
FFSNPPLTHNRATSGPSGYSSTATSAVPSRSSSPCSSIYAPLQPPSATCPSPMLVRPPPKRSKGMSFTEYLRGRSDESNQEHVRGYRDLVEAQKRKKGRWDSQRRGAGGKTAGGRERAWIGNGEMGGGEDGFWSRIKQLLASGAGVGAGGASRGGRSFSYYGSLDRSRRNSNDSQEQQDDLEAARRTSPRSQSRNGRSVNSSSRRKPSNLSSLSSVSDADDEGDEDSYSVVSEDDEGFYAAGRGNKDTTPKTPADVMFGSAPGRYARLDWWSWKIRGLVDSSLPLISVEHQRGVSLTPGLDNLSPVAAPGTSSRDSQASHLLLLISLSIRLLSTSSAILSSSFQPHLLRALYHVLSHLSPTSHPLLRSHAQRALFLISQNTGYASPQNLVLANVDYVINSVSQRLSVTRLDPAAPLVLVEMIRLVGSEIVPMVQDLVEDVFEALDDFHGYEEVTVGLWAVLDALMGAMRGDLVLKEEGKEGKQGKERRREGPDEESDWSEFEEWWKTRVEEKRDDEEEEDFGPNPQKPFKSTLPNQEDGPSEFPESIVVPATKPQITAAQIISKSLYFLSHSSPFLRSRVLSLIATAVPLLTAPSVENPQENRQADLLPVIHRAWPYILNRFADTEPYVVLEAAGLIESLATHVGSFMSRRILDDVWPRLRNLLETQDLSDRYIDRY